MKINLRGVVTDEELAALQQRNQERRLVAINALGSSWVGTPIRFKATPGVFVPARLRLAGAA